MLQPLEYGALGVSVMREVIISVQPVRSTGIDYKY